MNNKKYVVRMYKKKKGKSRKKYNIWREFDLDDAEKIKILAGC